MSGLVDWIQGAGLGPAAATFVVCFLSGLVPLINAEIFLIAAAALLGSPLLVVGLAAIAAAGQMAAKLLLFFAARGAIRLPLRRYEEKLVKAQVKIAAWRRRPYLILAVSAVVGLPPFYVVSLLAGALQIRLVPFCAIGFAGRFLRFAAVAALPAVSRLFSS